MKKFLFTCFLALLCLAGSPSSAQSRVADSPGADFLHRSGPTVSPHSGDAHRGGETFPDTFFPSYPSSSDNLTTASADNPTTPRYLNCEQYTAADCKLQTADYQSPGFSLVDDSTSQGQEESIPSAQVEEGMLYIELATAVPTDSLYLRFWDHLVSQRKSVTPGTSIAVPAREGNMFEGSRNYYVFTTPFPEVDSHGFFSIGKGRNALAKQWIYFPGDRVRIRTDLISGSLVFGGPDADFYRLQYEVDLAFREEQFNTAPVLLFTDSATFLQDPAKAGLWTQSGTRPQDLYVRLRLIESPQEAWSDFEAFANDSWLEHPAMKTLERYVSVLPAERLDLVETAIKGQLLYTGINKAEAAWPHIQKDPLKMAELREWIAGFGLADGAYSHPLLAQGIYQWTVMDAMAGQKPISEVFGELPNPLREEVIAFYILDNFNRMEDRLPGIIAQNLPLVESPWIRERLESLVDSDSRIFSTAGMYLEDGAALDPKVLEGKTLLIHFWISGCKFCLYDHQTVMRELSAKYADDPRVQIVTVNADTSPDTWRESLASGDYTSESALNLWVPKGTGLLKTHRIHSFPQKMLVSPDGSIQLQTINHMGVDELSDKLENTRPESTPAFSQPQTTDL